MSRWVLIGAVLAVGALWGYYVWNSQPSWYPERYGIQ